MILVTFSHDHEYILFGGDCWGTTLHGLGVLGVDINWDESPVSFSVTMLSYCGKNFSKVCWSRLGVKELTEKMYNLLLKH